MDICYLINGLCLVFLTLEFQHVIRYRLLIVLLSVPYRVIASAAFLGGCGDPQLWKQLISCQGIATFRSLCPLHSQ